MIKVWNSKLKVDHCFLEAFDTYTSLLSEDESLTDDQLLEYEDHVRYELFENTPEIIEVNLSDLESAKKVHSSEYSEDYDLYGVVVILENSQGEQLILDGNHRINSLLKSKTKDIKIPVCKLKGYIPVSN